MADFEGNIDPAAAWADVPLMTVEAVLMGGIGGALNEQAKALTARTKLLKKNQDDITDPTDPAKGSELVPYLPVAGGEAQSVAAKLKEFAGVHEYFIAPDADHSNAFERALAEAKRVYFDDSHGPFSLSGTIAMPSHRTIYLIGNPTIDITVDGDNRGIWWQQGTEGTRIFGDGYVRVRTDVAGSDGSYNGAFTFGQFYYVDDPLPIRNCGIYGNITVEGVGAANSKPVSIYGFVEDCEWHGVTGTGRTNYAFSAHWSSNGGVGILPTKTWHPHKLYFKRCKVHPTDGQVGQTLRAFTASACGKVVFEDCEVTDVSTLGLNPFVGDYGYTYAQNIGQQEAFDISIIQCLVAGLATGLSVDSQSSGLNGSPIWTGSDHNARLTIRGLDILIAPEATSTVGFAVSLIKHIDAQGLRVIEQGTTNATQALTLFGVGGGEIHGELVARFGSLVRACADVNLENLPIRSPLPEPDTARYGLSGSATSATATVSGAVTAGVSSITLAGNTLITGPGGYLQYDDGTTVHEVEILTSTNANATQTISIEPFSVDVPDAATVTVIQTNKRLKIGRAPIVGYASGVRTTGSATAKLRDLEVHAALNDSGVYDLDLDAVDGLIVRTAHANGGRRTTTANKYGIRIGPNTEMFDIRSRFGKKNTRLRYLVYVDNAAKNGIIEGCSFESFNAGATTPAAVFLQSATNVKYDPARNVYGTGVTTKYPA